MIFSTKAETLKYLEGSIKAAEVLPQFSFSVLEWKHNATRIVERFFMMHGWSSERLVVRSSGIDEDSESASLAGQFTSVLDVCGLEQLNHAVETVISSFGSCKTGDLVFFQPMLEDVVCSGVVFTCEPSTNSPYYVINFSEGNDTESVTAGKSNDCVLYISKQHYNNASLPGWVDNLIELCNELEVKFKRSSLDIEFAVNSAGKLFLFQIRPLLINTQKIVNVDRHLTLLQRIEKTVERIIKPHPYLNGERSVLGVMPDWNPAEIIGIRPKPLALSLYKELVTDSIWAYQRNNYGYKQLRSFPLLVSLCGLPYIDVRVSFNSFIPADIEHGLAEKLVNYYIKQLELRPEKHDKVEFDIIFSSFTLDLKKRLNLLLNEGFSEQELTTLAESLRTLTNNIINPNGLWVKDISKIESLPERCEKIKSSNLTKTEKIVWLLEDCKRYGTLPFAGLARAAFIAVQLLRSMVSEGILSEVDYDNYLRGLRTVNLRMNEDRAKLSAQAFLKVYGHLRPGTYDIMSPRYDQAPEHYFDFKEQGDVKECQSQAQPFLLSLEQLETIREKLESSGIDHDVISLFRFIKGAIEGREYAKFIFTKSLSDAIQLIEELGEEFQLTKDQLAYLDIKSLYGAYSSSENIESVMVDSIHRGERLYLDTESLILPPLIVHPEDVYQFSMPEGEPNYITMGKVSAPTISNLDSKKSLEGKIIFISAADPGFDWLFSANIAGLITQYGGANSHMAIRAGELGIPSVIGAGEVLYRKWQKSRLLEIDAANRRVVVLK